MGKWPRASVYEGTSPRIQEAQINVSDKVSVSVENGRIIIEPATKVRGKYDLKELVAKISQEYQAEELDWDEPVGKEVW